MRERIEQIRQAVQAAIENIKNAIQNIVSCVTNPVFWYIVAAILLFTIIWAGTYVWGPSDFCATVGGGNITREMMESLGWNGDLDDEVTGIDRLHQAFDEFGITHPIALIAIIQVAGPETSFGALVVEGCCDAHTGTTVNVNRDNTNAICHETCAHRRTGDTHVRVGERGAGFVQLTWWNTHTQFLARMSDGFCGGNCTGKNSADHIGKNYPWEAAAYYYAEGGDRGLGAGSINGWLEQQTVYDEYVCYAVNSAVLYGNVRDDDLSIINSKSGFETLLRERVKLRCRPNSGSYFDEIMASDFAQLAGGTAGSVNRNHCLGWGNNYNCLANDEIFELLGGAGEVTIIDCVTGVSFCATGSMSESYHFDWTPCTEADNDKIRDNFGYSWTHRKGMMTNGTEAWPTSFHTRPHCTGTWTGEHTLTTDGGGCEGELDSGTGHACAHFYGSVSKAKGYKPNPTAQENVKDVCIKGCQGFENYSG
jgi:hypothetical protein